MRPPFPQHDLNASGETNLKVLLATPIATKKDLWGQYHKGAGAYLPLGLLSIAGVIREAGHDVQLHDASTLGTTEAEFREYLRDGQFDDCDITLKELNRVEESLVKSLCRFYHGRVAYPKSEPKRETAS